MPRRLRVLLSAYACEPGKGSEPEVGWQWATRLARDHDVTVITRANNRASIEEVLMDDTAREHLPRFVYVDLSVSTQRWKKRLGATQLYYWLWQHAARKRVAELTASVRFDLLHHTTFAGYRYPTAITGHGVPSLWGPIGGVECIPWGLLPWRHPASLWRESFRNIVNRGQTTSWSALGRRAAQVTRTLASTLEMQRALAALGHQADLMPTIGLTASDFPPMERTISTGPLRLLYVGYLVALKGIDLAIEALHLSKTDATFTLVGDGNFTETCRALAGRLGLAGRVHFSGRKLRADVLALYREFDLVLFPSLHDTGGYTVLEAMANGLPVLCLDCGGPALAVGPSCGIKVPLGGRREVVRGLAAGIRFYNERRDLLVTQAPAARTVVAEQYDWGRKGEAMKAIYSAVARV
jgi:glycosyltransferase involved in cell wall biosynthesis